jgi:hypothetical protein
MSKTMKCDYQKILKVLAEATEASYKAHGNYAYIAGYYESLLAGLIDDQKFGNQRETLKRLTVMTDNLENSICK